MIAKEFKGMQTTATVPADWPEEMGTIQNVPVCFESGYVISAWKPTREEFAKLIDGGWVYLCIAVHEKRTMPAVQMMVSEASPPGEIA